MSRAYGITVSTSSVQYNNYVNALNIGPLSTNKYPNIVSNNMLGVLIGKHPNPPKFYPSEGASNFSNARSEYARITPEQQYNPTKYIAPPQSSLFLLKKKRDAIGKSSFKQGLPNSSELSYKCYFPTDVRTTIRRVRGGGCVAPKKKGAIENTSLRNGGACGWGAIARQNY
uniref:Uncharacterized protein n=1 Tax=viral metagenome TaxID=1070528 RepID=A0A6C0H6L1_9ZZZZ